MIGRRSYTLNKVRYLNKYNNENERENYSRYWKEQIEHYGTATDYFTNTYTLTSHNFLYGEDPTSEFVRKESVIMMTDITNDSLMLSKFGIMADCDMTAVIHISSFWEKFGCGHEPKAGDLIRLTEYGADRPGGRSAPIYEITERDDENVNLTNTLLGHYVWFIKCKRYEYSYEPGMEGPPNNKQINDGGDYGRLPGGANPEELFQPYPDSANNSAKCIYDYYGEDFNDGPNHFVPPQPPSCPENVISTRMNEVLGPYQKQDIFTQSDFDILVASGKLSADSFNVDPTTIDQVYINNNREGIMTRTLISDDNGTKTFVIQTSGKPEDDIFYTTNLSSVDLFSIAPGGII